MSSFKRIKTLTYVIDRHTVSHIAKVFAEKGSDSWWAEPLETLLPPDVLKKVNPHVFLYTL